MVKNGFYYILQVINQTNVLFVQECHRSGLSKKDSFAIFFIRHEEKLEGETS